MQQTQRGQGRGRMGGAGAGLGRPVRLALAGCLLLQTLSAEARPRRAPAVSAPSPLSPQRRAEQLLQSGGAALLAHDFKGAAQALDESFRLNPRPAVLFKLGQLALAEGQVVAAQDRMRRFLADPTRDATDTASTQEAERVLALPRPESSEVRLFGDAGSLIRLDARPIGVLPLEAPLLVPAGAHRISVELDGSQPAVELSVPDGRVLDVRFDRTTGTAAVTKLMLAELVVTGRGLPESAAEVLRSALAKLLLQQDIAPVPVRAEQAAPCGDEVSCLAQAAIRHGAEQGIQLAVDVAGPGKEEWMLKLSVIDPRIGSRSEPRPGAGAGAKRGEVAAAVSRTCPRCSAARVTSLLPSLLTDALGAARARESGDIEIRTTPAGAEVLLDGSAVGTTPYRGRFWAGPKEYLLRLPDFTEQRGVARVEGGKTSVIEVVLPPRVVAPGPVELKRGPRPLPRLIAGGIAIAAGIGMVGFGASALSVAGGCIESENPFHAPAPCPYLFGTVPVGAALLSVGLVVSAAGVGVIAWPPPLRAISRGASR